MNLKRVFEGIKFSLTAPVINRILENRFLVERSRMIHYITHSNERGISGETYCDHSIIVSLTSYGKRMNDVCITIESLMQQTIKPNRIILNVDKEYEFRPLPKTLQLQQDRGLEIKIVEPLRSYKKLIPTIEDNPESIIITVDDDVIYDFDLIERFVNAHIDNPDCILAGRTHVITMGEDGSIKPYMSWLFESSDTNEPCRLFFTGCGGVLYPPHCLDDQVLNKELFMQLAPTADDVWFNAMALKKGTKVIKVDTRDPHGNDFIVNENVQDVGLNQINTKGNMENDRQIKAVYGYFGLFDLLKNDI